MLSCSQEAGHARRILHQVPDVVVQIHLDQHIARQERPLDGVLLAIADLSHLAQLRAHVLQQALHALEASQRPAAYALAISTHSVHRRCFPHLSGSRRLYCHCYLCPVLLPAFTSGLNLAGAEEFEPPSSVLETDSLAVELTPLHSTH